MLKFFGLTILLVAGAIALLGSAFTTVIAGLIPHMDKILQGVAVLQSITR